MNFGEDFVTKGKNLVLSENAEIDLYVTGQLGGAFSFITTTGRKLCVSVSLRENISSGRK